MESPGIFILMPGPHLQIFWCNWYECYLGSKVWEPLGYALLLDWHPEEQVYVTNKWILGVCDHRYFSLLAACWNLLGSSLNTSTPGSHTQRLWFGLGWAWARIVFKSPHVHTIKYSSTFKRKEWNLQAGVLNPGQHQDRGLHVIKSIAGNCPKPSALTEEKATRIHHLENVLRVRWPTQSGPPPASWISYMSSQGLGGGYGSTTAGFLWDIAHFQMEVLEEGLLLSHFLTTMAVQKDLGLCRAWITEWEICLKSGISKHFSKNFKRRQAFGFWRVELKAKETAWGEGSATEVGPSAGVPGLWD